MRFLLVVCVVLSLACSKKPPSSNEAPPAAAEATPETEAANESDTEEALPKELEGPAPAANAAPVVKLVDPGQGARSELRLQIAPGSKQQLSIQVGFAAEASVASTFPVKAPLQLARYRLTLETKEATADGSVRVEVIVNEVKLTQSKQAEAQGLRKRTKAVLRTMKALKGRYTITPTGRTTGVEFDIPSDALRPVYDMTDNLQWALLAMMPSLPDEPVGVGATWTAHRGLSLGGMHLNQLATHELVERSETGILIRTTPLVDAEPQTFKNPGTPTELELLQLQTEGSGEVTWDLSAIAPSKAVLKLSLAPGVQIKAPPKDGSHMKTLIVASRFANVPPTF